MTQDHPFSNMESIMQGAGRTYKKCKAIRLGVYFRVLETARRQVWLKTGKLRGEW